jgi:hypothetical protein
MVRLGSVALMLLLGSTPTWAQPSPNSHQWRIGEVARHAWSRPISIASTEIAPNATFGLGVFGLKPDRARQPAVTVHETNMPRTRRAGIGLRLGF